MLYTSDIFTDKPDTFQSELQENVYHVLEKLSISYQRVETAPVISMEDCKAIDEKLNMKMIKTLFLCNRQKTKFYLFVTEGEKTFETKAFSQALEIARVSFVPKELFEEMLQTKIGAATIFSALVDKENKIQVVLDSDILANDYYGCSDGTRTGYLKLKTDDVMRKFLTFAKHEPLIIEV
ncbi:MAG: prolyl-tRNA synthetase associated domain-containing protein [Streptococcus sp.]|uniref:prolyl-tRNA synthetase associated domain-containing protein n=1 Tax=Streptococcus sp. TaxID=1306 RepID=UPI00258A30AB|nr:YbaK/EbsC family protein [Streptococcus sp.]MCR5051300.1 prolyl-tRNA synthetase associated domain-containing protein [Streptococcus sp.]